MSNADTVIPGPTPEPGPDSAAPKTEIAEDTPVISSKLAMVVMAGLVLLALLLIGAFLGYRFTVSSVTQVANEEIAKVVSERNVANDRIKELDAEVKHLKTRPESCPIVAPFDDSQLLAKIEQVCGAKVSTTASNTTTPAKKAKSGVSGESKLLAGKSGANIDSTYYDTEGPCVVKYDGVIIRTFIANPMSTCKVDRAEFTASFMKKCYGKTGTSAGDIECSRKL